MTLTAKNLIDYSQRTREWCREQDDGTFKHPFPDHPWRHAWVATIHGTNSASAVRSFCSRNNDRIDLDEVVVGDIIEIAKDEPKKWYIERHRIYYVVTRLEDTHIVYVLADTLAQAFRIRKDLLIPTI
jgi:hypothetical protein